MKIEKRRKPNFVIASAVGLCVMGIGLYTLSTLAAGPVVNYEAEASNEVPEANVIDDPTASGSKAVRFGTDPTTIPDNSSPYRGKGIYNDGRLAAEGRAEAISSTPIAIWVGDWSNDPGGSVNGDVTAAESRGEIAAFVLYNIPGRDCGQYSAGGAGDSGAYRSWIDQIVNGIGQREAIIVLEPDALPQLECLNEGAKATRIGDMAYAVDAFTTKTKAYVYIDAGNASWKTPAEAAGLLQQVGINKVRGFSLNVSNFDFTADVAEYGDAVAALVGDKHYLIDTSRNGKGPTADRQWCNPPGRGLGVKPTTTPSLGKYVDAYLWIKTPGQSDGTCNGGPAAGQWFESYAQGLIANAVYDLPEQQ
ncbi:glycoside hydrolase family 6 protein [Candidatus Saccharibacteria bacterium]|nr:glycoside hydrolase family 6 protein [Candidatus Saccharibacteria bacterium]